MESYAAIGGGGAGKGPGIAEFGDFGANSIRSSGWSSASQSTSVVT